MGRGGARSDASGFWWPESGLVVVKKWLGSSSPGWRRDSSSVGYGGAARSC